MQDEKRDKDADARRQKNDDAVTEAGEESFPASDPPSFDPGTTGAPPDHGKPRTSGDETAEGEASDSEGEWMKTTAEAVETEMARRREMGVSEHPPAGTQPAPGPRKAGTSWTAILVILIALVVAVWLVWLLVT